MGSFRSTLLCFSKAVSALPQIDGLSNHVTWREELSLELYPKDEAMRFWDLRAPMDVSKRPSILQPYHNGCARRSVAGTERGVDPDTGYEYMLRLKPIEFVWAIIESWRFPSFARSLRSSTLSGEDTSRRMSSSWTFGRLNGR